MKFCVQCGNQLTEGATFCTSCGARVAPETSHAHGDDAPTQMARAASESSVRLPGSGSRQDDDQGAARPSLGATAYPAPPTQGNGNGDVPQRLGQQYDWGTSSGTQDADAPARATTPPDTTPGAESSDATQKLRTAQPHDAGDTSRQDDAERLGTHTSSAQGETYASTQPYGSADARQPSSPRYDATQPVGQHLADQQFGEHDASTSQTGQYTSIPARNDEPSHPLGQQYASQQPYDATQQMPQGQQLGGQHAGSQPYVSAPHQGYASTPQNDQFAAQQYGSAPHQGYPSARQSNQPYGGQQYTGQQHASAAPQQGYASAPSTSAAPQGAQYDSTQQWGMQNQNTQSQGMPGVAQAQRPAVDWKALTPGLLRLLAAVTLALTALGNWWTGDNTSSPDTYGTTHSVFALIGCIGVVLACIAQIAVLPQFLGAAMQPVARFAIRAVLCLPALIAVVIALVTNLGGPDSGKASLFAVTLLAMAIGFALAGLDDAREAVPADGLRWCAIALAGLGIVLNIVSMIQFMGADSYDDHAKEMWLIGIFSLIFVAAIGALVIWLGVARPAFGTGLMVALAGAVALSAITRGWICSNESLSAMTPARHGHGAALIALALALATAHEVTSRSRDDAGDDASVARRMTQWVVQGFVVAAVAAAFNALAFIGGRSDYTPGGFTWFLVLMIVTALVYGACAFLLKTNPMGRLVAVISAVTISLTILITIAASKSSGAFCEAFTEGAYLWLPLVAAAALTLPPAVRRIAGPITPQARSAAPQADTQQQFAQAPQGQFGHGQFDQGQQSSPNQFGHGGQDEGQYGQASQQWNGQQSQNHGPNNSQG